MSFTRWCGGRGSRRDASPDGDDSLGVGGVVGALTTGGAWGLMLWRQLGNHIFPLFNAVFQSGIGPDEYHGLAVDARSHLNSLAYPFYWMLSDHRSSEFPFRDARFAVAMVLILFGIGRSPSSALPSSRSGTLNSAVLRRLLCDMARPVFYSALRRRPGAAVCAVDHPADFPLPGRPTRTACRAHPQDTPNSVMAATALLIALWSQPGTGSAAPVPIPTIPHLRTA